MSAGRDVGKYYQIFSLSPSRKGVSMTIVCPIHSPAILSYTQPPQPPTRSVEFIISDGMDLRSITSDRTDLKLNL